MIRTITILLALPLFSVAKIDYGYNAACVPVDYFEKNYSGFDMAMVKHAHIKVFSNDDNVCYIKFIEDIPKCGYRVSGNIVSSIRGRCGFTPGTHMELIDRLNNLSRADLDAPLVSTLTQLQQALQ